MDFSNLSIKSALELLVTKRISSAELIKYYVSRIEQLNPTYNVFLFTESKEKLLEQALLADNERKEGSTKKLLGIPFTIKDSFMALGTPTTAGDLYLENTKSEFNSTVVQKLLDEGAILLGKVNMDSWGFGSSTENSSFGVTLNPIDTSRVAGGSSGGSAASVALDLCTFSIGEDTGGSVRCPASFCGVYALKPTYGRISRYGCISYASSLDTVGPITRTSEDLEILFSILEGIDNKDTTLETKPQTSNTENKKFAYSHDFIPEDGVSLEVRQAYLDTIELFKQKGYEAIEYSFPFLKYAVSTYYITAMSEASTNLSRYHGTRYGKYTKKVHSNEASPSSWEDLFISSRTEGFGQEAKRRIFLGSYVLSEGYYDAYYKKAQKIRNLIYSEINKILESVDFILSPVTPKPAMRIGEKSSNPVEMYLEDIYTVTANLAGIPSLAFPTKQPQGSLPIGMQIMGNKFSDEQLIHAISVLS